jgi:hypothetical protein
MTLRTPFALMTAVFLFQNFGVAQEVDCSVQANYEAIPNSNKDLLRDFVNDVKTYVNNYTWGAPNTGAKVKCTLNIFIQSVTGENKYSAQIYIGSQRQIYNTEQNSAVVRIFDDAWEFTYVRTNPLHHNPYVFDDLASILDFYMFLVVGFDNDTYDEMGGTPTFQKAADVASVGRSSSQKGWNASTSPYSRAQLIDEIMNPTYAPVRRSIYRYHYSGLDSLAYNRQQAQLTILQAVKTIGDVRKRGDIRSLLVRLFFDAKAKEIADLFVDYPDPDVYDVIIDADPSHQMVYDAARKSRNN